MSDADGTCDYVLDLEDIPPRPTFLGDDFYIDTELFDDRVWNCPHKTKENKNFCIFHTPVSEKDDKIVVDSFLELIESDENVENKSEVNTGEFLGAKFGKFELNNDGTRIGESLSRLDFSLARFNGPFKLANLSLGSESLNFSGAKFKKEVSFRNIEFNSEVDFSRAQFEGSVLFSRSEFKQEVQFREAEFFGKASFNLNNIFDKQVDFAGTEFKGGFIVSAEFRDRVIFTTTKFDCESNFISEFENLVDFTKAEFIQEATFRGSEFKNSANFNNTKFSQGIDFSETSIDGTFQSADLSDAIFTDASLCSVNLESALLSRATLFSSDLRGAKLNGTVLGDVRIDDDTKFLGHPSDDSGSSPHTISAIRSQPTCVYDPSYEMENKHENVDKAKSVYRALEELGGKHARPRLQARSFVRRQDLQKQDYWNDATADDVSLEERLIAGARWSRAKVARATLLYGESPWRVIGWSLGIILSFALLYPLGGWMKPTDGDPITYAQIASNPAEILNAVYYSTLTYTALGFGDFQPRGFGRLLTTVETGLGAVMLALLVFILGRRAAR